MPTLQIKSCPRLAAVMLLALALAQLAAPANADVQIEVHGVGEAIRANVLAYLSFERYKNSDDLSTEFVERLQAYLDVAPTLRGQVPNIDYVDVRFDRKVYVCAQPSRGGGRKIAGGG